jgi:peptidoglycan/LPS O-acetylase OafA/YrhL
MNPKSNNLQNISKLDYVPSLDGLRAIAVTMVMFLHAHFYLGKNGAIGVQIFFILSGFLITTILLDEFYKYGTVNIRIFYFKRTLRLFPALFTMLIVIFVYAFFTENLLVKNTLFKEITASALYISNLVYGKGWWKNHHPIALTHTWSLAVEEQFYLIWPCLFLLMMFYVGIKCLKVALIFLFLFSISYYFINSHSLYNILDESLILGCLIALFRFSGNVTMRISPTTLFISLLLLTFYGISPFTNYSFSSSYLIISRIFVDILSSIVLLGLVDDSSKNFTKKLLSSNLFVYFGKISYSLYLWHKPVFVYFSCLSLSFRPSTLFILKFFVSLILAILSWEIIEKKIINFGKSYLYKSKFLNNS